MIITAPWNDGMMRIFSATHLKWTCANVVFPSYPQPSVAAVRFWDVSLCRKLKVLLKNVS